MLHARAPPPSPSPVSPPPPSPPPPPPSSSSHLSSYPTLPYPTLSFFSIANLRLSSPFASLSISFSFYQPDPLLFEDSTLKIARDPPTSDSRRNALSVKYYRRESYDVEKKEGLGRVGRVVGGRDGGWWVEDFGTARVTVSKEENKFDQSKGGSYRFGYGFRKRRRILFLRKPDKSPFTHIPELEENDRNKNNVRYWK
ncbi:hypothetical protein V1477_000442, partial [Vespula maculifrons]